MASLINCCHADTRLYTTDAMNEENDSLVRAGGMVEDDEDIKPEFVDIVKTKGSSIDRKPVGAMVYLQGIYS